MTMVVLIIQARMGSTRLPGKVLLPINGRPMLSYQIERLRRCQRIDRMVVATTTAPADDAIVAFCEGENVESIRGSEQDVLSRYVAAARAFAADVVVRVTSDCPLLDPSLVDAAIEGFQSDGVDFLSNMIRPTWPYGMAVEVMSREGLEQAHEEARDPDEREHVTLFFYRRPERYRLKSLVMKPDLSIHRWTVDTREDFELVTRILGTLYGRTPDFQMDDVLALIAEHPEWAEINRYVVQKAVASTTKEK